MPNIKKTSRFFKGDNSFVLRMLNFFCVCAHHLSSYLHFYLNWIIFKINYRLKDNLVIFISKFRRYRKVFFIKCFFFLFVFFSVSSFYLFSFSLCYFSILFLSIVALKNTYSLTNPVSIHLLKLVKLVIH